MKKSFSVVIFLIVILVLNFFAFYVPTVQANPDDWVSPTGYEDPDNAWNNEANAYDEDTGSRADTNLGFSTWSKWLYLNIDEISCDKVRFWVECYGGFPPTSKDPYIDLDVIRDGETVDVFEGVVSRLQWVEKSFDSGMVTSMHMRFMGSTFDFIYVYEADFWEVEVAGQELTFDFSETTTISSSLTEMKEKKSGFTETTLMEGQLWKYMDISQSFSAVITSSPSILIHKEIGLSLSALFSMLSDISILKEIAFVWLEVSEQETISPFASLNIYKELSIKISELIQAIVTYQVLKEKWLAFSNIIKLTEASRKYMELSRAFSQVTDLLSDVAITKEIAITIMIVTKSETILLSALMEIGTEIKVSFVAFLESIIIIGRIEFSFTIPERVEEEGEGGGIIAPPSYLKQIGLAIIIIIIILGLIWIYPDLIPKKYREEIRKHQPTLSPRKHEPTVKPRKHKSTVKPRRHKSTLKPRSPKSTIKPRRHKSTVKPRKHKRR